MPPCRASRPFSRTPVRLPLAVNSSEIPSSSAPQHEPAPLAWTPMRAQAMTPQTRGFRGFGVKRMREGEGTPGTLGTPLLQAGQASEAVRRTRQRSDKVCAHLEHPKPAQAVQRTSLAMLAFRWLPV